MLLVPLLSTVSGGTLYFRPHSQEKSETGNVVCPGGQFQCPTGNTCCKQSSGQYGCCPLPNVSLIVYIGAMYFDSYIYKVKTKSLFLVR